MTQKGRINMEDGIPCSSEVMMEIERFLYREARLLDRRLFREWHKLLSEDIRYWVPVRSVVKTDDARKEFASPRELALFDETKKTLQMRIEKLETSMAWSEDPPSRTCRIVSNIEAEETGTSSVYRVYSQFLIYRTRLENTQDLFAGSREDILRKDGGSWKIDQRTVYLAQTHLLSDNVSIFL
jgi:3-phenylpropionate/cinnamic acid dioxygenase small subunit